MAAVVEIALKIPSQEIRKKKSQNLLIYINAEEVKKKHKKVEKIP